MSKQLPVQSLAEFRKDRGLTQKALADKLNLPKHYITLYETGKAEASSVVKDIFRKKFPGYQVHEMRLPDDYEPERSGPVSTTVPIYKSGITMKSREVKPMKEETKSNQPSKGKTIVYLLERDDDIIAYGSKEEMHQDIIYLAIKELNLKTREVELR